MVLGEYLYDDHISINGSVHGFSADQQDWLVERWYPDSTLCHQLVLQKQVRSAHLKVVVLVSDIVTLEVTATLDTGSEHILRKILLVSNRY